MDKEAIILEAGRPVLRPLGWIQAVFIAIFLSSPIVWIWTDWSIGWKVALTGIIGILIFRFLYSVTKKTVSEMVDKEIENQTNNTKPISKFQKRLNKMMEESKT